MKWVAREMQPAGKTDEAEYVPFSVVLNYRKNESYQIQTCLFLRGQGKESSNTTHELLDNFSIILKVWTECVFVAGHS